MADEAPPIGALISVNGNTAPMFEVMGYSANGTFVEAWSYNEQEMVELPVSCIRVFD